MYREKRRKKKRGGGGKGKGEREEGKKNGDREQRKKREEGKEERNSKANFISTMKLQIEKEMLKNRCIHLHWLNLAEYML